MSHVRRLGPGVLWASTVLGPSTGLAATPCEAREAVVASQRGQPGSVRLSSSNVVKYVVTVLSKLVEFRLDKHRR